jgi:tetratricopeptide (TPR) repeat protein
MNEYPKALSYYDKGLVISQRSLSPNLPDLADSCNNIGNVYNNMGDYSKACSFYERAVNIGQQSLPSNHLDLKKWKENFDIVKKKL